MASGSSLVKKSARTILKGNWTASIFVACIPLFTVFICSYSVSLLAIVSGELIADILFLILGIFLIFPMCLGLLRFFWRVLFGKHDSPVLVFYYFSDKSKYWKSLLFILSMAFKAMIYGVLLNIPMFILNVITHSFMYELIGISLPVWTANLTNVKIILEVVAKVVLISIMLKFYLTPMLFVADDNMESAEAMHMSSVISKKSSVDFIYLGFSFIIWIILSFLVIPIIFTLPYAVVSYLIHARIVVAEYNAHIEQIGYDYQSYMA